MDAGSVAGSADGLYVDDRRVLHHLKLLVNGTAPEAVACDSAGPQTVALLVARNIGDAGPDPTVHVTRRLELVDGGLDVCVEVASRSMEPLTCTVHLELAGDGAEVHEVKAGAAAGHHLPITLEEVGQGSWADNRHATTVHAFGAHVRLEGGVLVAHWDIDVEPGATATLRTRVRVRRTASTPFDAGFGAHQIDWEAVKVDAQDARLARTVYRSLTDLRHLVLSDPDDPRDVFAAAGTPWYLTLFGRDSIWAARMCLPFGTDLAGGTLRALARRQGTVDDIGRAEEPGKILHEIRRGTFSDPGHLHLPPLYYGTVDATPLWVTLLHDAWRWGLPAHDVQALGGPLLAALSWMQRSAQDSSDGFLRYLDLDGTGLSNQGWKDSGDSMRTATGLVAEGPIALVETQAYAVEAALGAADVLEEVCGQDGDPWRQWAADLAARVREHFWVASPSGPYLAMALDGNGHQVDGVGSNMGHVLGTGTLTADEEAHVAHRLTEPDLLGPLGVSTLSRDNPAYNPLGYHTGSVWTHDTAIAAWGLSRTGHGAAAGTVLRALVDVASSSGYRWPELYSAEPVLETPVPYPASCRPQAWAAASSGLLVTAALGLRADAPAGVLEVVPLPQAPFGALRVEGIRVAGRPIAIEVDGAGQVVDVQAPDGIEVRVLPPSRAGAGAAAQHSTPANGDRDQPPESGRR
ncbi:MAG: amylo-alpha-1,6-glucosidase [Actinomycetota bacterium]|nr:amylo-alpha-1,6-glucosidase [Actinomycetota bacterium]